jgi:CheY-like chemotaxis protein
MTPHCVLIVEDNADVRETLVEFLQSYGYDAVGAEHGREALDKLDQLQAQPCVILLDLMMPVMDGPTFRQEQLNKPNVSGIPVVVISAYDAPAQTVKDLNAAAYLRKPLNLNELMRVVQHHCSSS